MGIQAEEFYINDFSYELISLYNNIASNNEEFFNYVEKIDESWKNATLFFKKNYFLINTYINFRNGQLTKEDLTKSIHQFCIEKKTTSLI